MGAPCRKMDSKVATAPMTQSQYKDKDIVEWQNEMVKLNIIKPESFTQSRFL